MYTVCLCSASEEPENHFLSEPADPQSCYALLNERNEPGSHSRILWLIQTQTKGVRDMVMALEHLQHGQLGEPLSVVTQELKRAIQDLIRLSLANHHQQLTREPLPRRGCRSPEEFLAEDGSRCPAVVELKQVVCLEPLLQHVYPAGVYSAAREGCGEENSAAEERLGAGVQLAEEHGRGEVQAARALAESDHLVRVSSVLGDVGLDPFEGGGDVLSTVGVVPPLQRQAICDETCDEAVAGEIIA